MHWYDPQTRHLLYSPRGGKAAVEALYLVVRATAQAKQYTLQAPRQSESAIHALWCKRHTWPDTKGPLGVGPVPTA